MIGVKGSDEMKEKREKIVLGRPQTYKLTLAEGFQKFIALKKAMKASSRTVEFYEACYKYFTEYCDPNTLAEDITKDTVIGYLIHIHETKPNISDQTVDSYMRGTKPIIKFLMESGYTENFVFPKNNNNFGTYSIKYIVILDYIPEILLQISIIF